MKTNSFSITISFIIFLPLFISCKKSWLDKKTDRSITVPSTLKDFQTILDNTNIFNEYSPALGEMGCDDHYVPESIWNNFVTDEERNAYTWSHSKPNINQREWIYPYERVFYCNVVLDGLAKVEPSNSDEEMSLNNCKGNVLFHRAKTFFELAQNYAPPYKSSTATAELSIPLRVSSDINIPSVRSSVKETYDLIINDLLAAKNLLPIMPVYKTRASKPAALALLSRVFLSMCEYEKAFQYANECLGIYANLIDYNSINSSAAYPMNKFNNEVIFHSRMLYQPIVTNNSFIDTSFYNQYSANDLRRTLFYIINQNNSISFRGMYNDGVNNFTGLATDEVYLIRAECYARKGNMTAAMSDLNTLLEKRWVAGNFVPFTALTANDALLQILKERRKELILRGLRWSDLRRLNQESNFAITINRTIGGSTYTLEPGSYKYTFPLPDDIVQQTGMPQNSQW